MWGSNIYTLPVSSIKLSVLSCNTKKRYTLFVRRKIHNLSDYRACAKSIQVSFFSVTITQSLGSSGMLNLQ